MKTFLLVVLVIVLAPIFFIGYHSCVWVGNAATTVREQFSPSTMLARYEWFKDAYSRLNAFDANLSVYSASRKSLLETYGADATKWPKDVRQEIAQQRREIDGIVAARNNLAADYNASMAKFNWRFTNAGDLPAGATVVLPREVATYIIQ